MCGKTGRWCDRCVCVVSWRERRQNAILLVKYIVSEAIPDVPAHVTERLARQVRRDVTCLRAHVCRSCHELEVSISCRTHTHSVSLSFSSCWFRNTLWESTSWMSRTSSRQGRWMCRTHNFAPSRVRCRTAPPGCAAGLCFAVISDVAADAPVASPQSTSTTTIHRPTLPPAPRRRLLLVERCAR